MNYHSNLLFLMLFIFVASCQNEKSQSKTKSNPLSDPEKKEEATVNPSNYENFDQLQTKALVYAWVDKLNIRNAPNLKGKAITSVDSDDALEFLGKRSDEKETIVLRGIAYEDSWLKVMTPDKEEGWVFGGAVKRKEEKKGNDIITDEKFDFPKFGKFDLTTWNDMGTKNEEEGDAEIEYHTYKKENQVFEFTKIGVGDYGYSRMHKLMRSDYKIIKMRELGFSGDADPKRLIITISDFTTSPPKQYTRTQEIKKHHSQLNSYPMIAIGDWKEQIIDDPILLDNSIQKIEINELDYQECKILAANDSGCSCDFRTGKNYKSSSIFTSDIDKNACININGETFALTGGFSKNGFDELQANSEKEDWITFNEKGDHLLFGKKYNIGSDYEGERDKIVQTLLVMPKLPERIPTKMNGTVGMGIRGEAKDMCTEALKLAKAARKKSNYGVPARMSYSNKKYEIIISARVIGKDDGGGNKYEGILEVFSSEGNRLSQQKVWGGCGC